MKTSSRCLAVLVGIVVAVLAFNPIVGSAAAVNVTVGNGGPVFTPSSVTIQQVIRCAGLGARTVTLPPNWTLLSH